MKPKSGTSDTRRDATVGQYETARLIARVNPGAACPGGRAAAPAALADAAGLLRAEGCHRLAARLRGQP